MVRIDHQLRASAGVAAIAWDAWRAQRRGRAAILQRQRQRLADILVFARQHSRFYAERADLPVTKPQLLASFDDWITDPRIGRADLERFAHDSATVGTDFLGRFAVFTTSGSTGEPAVIAHDRHALAVFAALSLVRGTLAWRGPVEIARVAAFRQRQAAVFATGAHLPTAAIAERQRRLGKPVRLFSLLDPLPRLTEELNAYAPTRVDSYPSALAMLAAEQRAGRLRIAPRLLTCVGETLTAEVRSDIEDAFGQRVFQHYSAAETGPIAFECWRQTLHVNDDWFVLEPVDRQGQPVGPGTPSHAVWVTSLINRVQPLLRYGIGDTVTVQSEPCGCGSPLTAVSVEGPRDEPLDLVSPSGSKRLWPLVVYGRLKQLPQIDRYQIVQCGPAELSVRLEPRADVSLDLAWQATQAALRALVALPDVAIELAPELPAADPRSGKFRFQWTVAQPPAGDRLS